MTSRERVNLALQHKAPDRVPLDLGATTVTGMHVSAVYKLRQALALDAPGTPVKVIEPLQMLGEIKLDLVEALGIDTVRLAGTGTSFGFKLEGWKEWRTFDDTPALVPEGFNTILEPDGDLLMYPQGDRSAKPSGRMPKGGLYFDPIFRQAPIDENNLNVEDNLEEFGPLPNSELEHLKRKSERLCTETDKAIILNLGMFSLGDIAKVPGQMLKDPKGIRSAEEWYISLSARRDYIYKVFERQTEINLANLERIHQAVGNRPAVAYLTGTDFGTQNGPLLAPKIYRELFLPFHKQMNDWVHKHTTWKTFLHSCGSVFDLIEDFIAAGFDILNPVQTSAARMDPGELKRNFGERLTFWGGGVDTQCTLPFGSADDVRREVRERLRLFGPGGGFVFNAIHNIQAQVPVANVLAMYDAALSNGRYSL
ncbi:MAG TPA: uroporphyrinogen decarboxylase family protein [Terriglobia bacterium]|nr:uroporphyrinogen decarboxylase family protein [Terriglobia bacterium]